MLVPYLIFIGFMSIITAIAFAVDKAKSKGGDSRTPEMVLLSLASLGGALGALFGMYIVRHKTNPVEKFHFAITVWVSLAAQVVGGLIIAGVIGGIL